MAFNKLPIDPQVDALIRLLVIAEMHSEAALKDALASGQVGSARYRRQRLMILKQQLQETLARVKQQAPEVIRDSAMIGMHIANAPHDTKLQYGFGMGQSAKMVDNLTKNMLSSIEGGIHTLGRNTEDIFRRVGLRQTALHLLEGSTRREASKRMEAQLMRQGMTSFVDRANHHWKLSTYSAMVIRTTTREAVTAGTTQGMTDTGADLVEIFEHVNACEICAPYRGQTYSLTGSTAGYTVLARKPPFHPQCRCVMGPAKSDFEALEASLGLAPSVGTLFAA